MSSTKASSSSNYANEIAKGLYIQKFLPYPMLLQYLWESSLQWLFPAQIKHTFTWLWSSGVSLNGSNVNQYSPDRQMVSTEMFDWYLRWGLQYQSTYSKWTHSPG